MSSRIERAAQAIDKYLPQMDEGDAVAVLDLLILVLALEHKVGAERMASMFAGVDLGIATALDDLGALETDPDLN